MRSHWPIGRDGWQKKNQKRKEKEQGLSPRTNQRPGPTYQLTHTDPPTPFHPLPHLPPVKGHVVKEIYLERKRKDSNTKSSRNGTTFVEIGQVGRRFRFFFFLVEENQKIKRKRKKKETSAWNGLPPSDDPLIFDLAGFFFKKKRKLDIGLWRHWNAAKRKNDTLGIEGPQMKKK